MPALPWQGFWKSVARRADRPHTPSRRRRTRRPGQPWQAAAQRRRWTFVLLVLGGTVLASVLFAQVQPAYESAWLGWGRIALFALLSAWGVRLHGDRDDGFWVMLRGDKHSLSARSVAGHALSPEARTAIIMPICNEDVATVFAGLRATCESVAATATGRRLTCSCCPTATTATLPAQNAPPGKTCAWHWLPTRSNRRCRCTYRLRKRRTHRKAGNGRLLPPLGQDYRYMVVLDADSVMSGDCIVSMAGKLMEANPTAGIIQTATQAIGHVTLHARAQQFASRVTGRLFTLGMQFWQLGESHYWGTTPSSAWNPSCSIARSRPSPARGPGGRHHEPRLCGSRPDAPRGLPRGWWPTWWAATSSNRPTCWPNCSATAAGARQPAKRA